MSESFIVDVEWELLTESDHLVLVKLLLQVGEDLWVVRHTVFMWKINGLFEFEFFKKF